jgi:hypothetical protein
MASRDRVSACLIGHCWQVGSQHQILLENIFASSNAHSSAERPRLCFQDEVRSPCVQPILREWRLIGYASNKDLMKDFGHYVSGYTGVIPNPRSLVWNTREVSAPIDSSEGVIPQAFAKCYGVFIGLARPFCLTQELSPDFNIERWIATVVHDSTSESEVPVPLLSKSQIAGWDYFDRQIRSVHLEGLIGGLGGTLGGGGSAEVGLGLNGSVIGVRSGNEHETYRTDGLQGRPPVRRFLCVVCFLFSLACAIGFVAAFVNVDSWRTGWRWGLGWCLTMTALFMASVRLIHLALSVAGAK